MPLQPGERAGRHGKDVLLKQACELEKGQAVLLQEQMQERR